MTQGPNRLPPPPTSRIDAVLSLCLDTSAATTVALVNDTLVLSRAANKSTRHHAESIAVLVTQVLTEAGLAPQEAAAGLDRVCVGTGPAPFTGLRAGLVSARVYARAAAIPVYGVSSLDAIARAALDLLPRETRVLAISDARRKELYWGLYTAEGADDVHLEGRLEVGSAAALLSSLRQRDLLIVSAGPIPAHSAEALAVAEFGPQVELDPAIFSRIVSARLARGEADSLSTAPLYLRRPEIHGQPMERL